jgi:hypothetical protein
MSGLRPPRSESTGVTPEARPIRERAVAKVGWLGSWRLLAGMCRSRLLGVITGKAESPLVSRRGC